MKKIIQLVVLLSSACVAFSQGVIPIPVVIPNANANVEGNSSSSEPFNSPSFRMQMVFDASQFSAIPPGASGRIDSIAFRIDGASGGNVIYSFGGGSVTASLTPVLPDGMSSIFGNNVGANPVTIFNGAMAFGNSYVPGANPQPFGNSIGAQVPFWYRPSQGNLLLDIAGAGGQTVFPGSLDAQFASGDSVSRVFALNGNSLTGTPDTLGFITRINFTVIPEPATWMLAILGFASVFLLRRR